MQHRNLLRLFVAVSLMLGLLGPAQILPARNAQAQDASILSVTQDGTPSSGTDHDVSTISVGHTTGTGTNRLMLVGVVANNYTTAFDIDSVSFTYDSTELELTEVGTQTDSGRQAAIYGLLAPPSGQSGTVTVDFSAAIAYSIVVGVANFQGVFQTVPLGAFAGATGNWSGGGASLELTGLDGDELVFDTLFGGGQNSPTLVVGAGQSELWNVPGDESLSGGGSTEQAAGSSVTMSWTSDLTSGVWILAAVPIKPVPTGPTIVTSGTLSEFSTTPGTPSAAQTYTVSGINLTEGILVTAPTGFELATTGGGSYSGSLTLPDVGGTVASTDVYVRLTGDEGTFSGNITHTSAGATQKDVAVSGSASNCVTRTISQSSDDAYQSGTTVTINSTYLQAVSGTTRRYWGLRFQNVTVPKGATITTASVTFRAAATSASGTPTLNLWGEASDDAATFAATYNNISSRSQTSSVSWSMGAWTSGQDYTTSSLVTPVQEIVNRSGWASGNALVIMSQEASSGYSDRRAVAWDDTTQANEAALTICFTPPVYYALTASDDGNGSVTLDPAGGSYASGTVVTLTPVPNSGYLFSSWSGGDAGDLTDNGNGTWSITMNGTKSVTANFVVAYTLTAGTDGDGSVTLEPAGGIYTSGTVVTLTPVPNACYEFDHWSGTDSGDVSDNGDGTWSITMDANKSVTANFATASLYTLTAGDDGNGSVTLNPAGGSYCPGTTVTLTPVPDCGYAFDHWSGTDESDLTDNGDGTWSILMDDNKSVTANFAAVALPYLDGDVYRGTLASGTSISFDAASGACTDRLMLVGVSWNCGSTDRTIVSITFTPDEGEAAGLTEVWTQLGYSTSNPRYSAIYSLVGPPSGQAGTVTVNFSGSVSNGIMAGAANFAGVDQTTPLGTPDGAAANSTTPSIAFTGLDGDELVFDNVFLGAGSSSYALTAGSGQTELWNPDYVANLRAAASVERATGSAVTMDWTASTGNYWAIAAVPINPAPAPSATLIVEKQTEPDGGTDEFTFTGDAAGTIHDDETITVSGLAPGDYYVQETTPPEYYRLASIVCDDGNSVGDVGSREAHFQLEAGETVTCTFVNAITMDYGDAPDSYKTLWASDGPRHSYTSPGNVSLEGVVDYELDGYPSPGADGDDLSNPTDDENGVTLPPTLTAGDAAASVTVDVFIGTGNAMLDAWIDFNGNSVFDHPTEHLWGGTSQALANGTHPLTFAVPADATPGPTYARFRVSFAGGLPPDGLCIGGEVEDYTVEIVAAPTTGTIVVEKQTEPDGATDLFTFTEDVSGSIADGGTIVTGDLAPGLYYAVEIVPEGWSLRNVTCSDANSTGDLPNFRAAYNLEAGETVTCTFYNVQNMDYGDAPDSYKTLLVSDGPRHLSLMGGLGPSIDVETDGHPSALADGDDLDNSDDEDGVDMPATVIAGDVAAAVTVYATYAGGTMLDAWIDFDGNGVFDHPLEHLWGGSSQTLDISPKILTFAVPVTATVGPTYARFRSSGSGGLAPFGFAVDGEVEDYQVEILEPCYTLTLGKTGNGTTPTASPTHSSGCWTGSYHSGQSITLSATPDTGWRIDSWYGTSDPASDTFTMPASAHSAGVNYVQNCYELTVGHYGSGSDPTPSPGSSPQCGSSQREAAGLIIPVGHYYVYGEIITLSDATPDTGWEIDTWYGTGDPGSNTFSMPASPHSAGVNYVQTCYELTLGHSGNGSYPTPSPDNSAACVSALSEATGSIMGAAHRYVYGEAITLSGATPDPGWEITGWYGTSNDSSTQDNNSLTMPNNPHTVGVNYQQGTATLIVEKQTQPDGWTSQDFQFTGDATGFIADGEQITVSDLPAGIYYVQEVVPAGWTLTDISCDDGDSVEDEASFEAEFHLNVGETVKCTFYDLLPLDFGDAPDSYKTLLASDGARHVIIAGHSLGPMIDAELDGQPSVTADLDDLLPAAPDDEDGVTLQSQYFTGDPAAEVDVEGGSSGGMLDAWIDFDGNGVFDDPAEHLWAGVSQALGSGPNLLTFAVPVTAVLGSTYARFRLSIAGGLPPYGFAPDGEVEDYTANILPACYALTLGHSGNGTTPTASPTHSSGCESGYYVSGESISLSGASPDTGWHIASWTGTDDDLSTASSNSLTMPASAHSASVNYAQTCYPLTLGHTGNGTTPTASPTNSAGCAAGEYVYGESISLSGATPDTGWEIDSWTGTDYDSSKASSNSLIMPASARSAGVNYVQTCYALTLGHTGNGTTPSASPTNSTGCAASEYVYGENIDLSEAIPDTGWGVRNWFGTSHNPSEAMTNSLTMPASPWEAGVNYGRVLGDVDGDGLASSTDALLVLSADAAIDTHLFCPMNYGDVNGDGWVNSTDALIILTYDVGLPVGTFPVGHAVAEPVLTIQPPGCGAPGLSISRWSRAPLRWLLSVAQLDVK